MILFVIFILYLNNKSMALTARQKERLKEEVDKCDLLCSNCHYLIG